MMKKCSSIFIILIAVSFSICKTGNCSPKLYWGDLHGHSNLSDGTNSPYWYFSYCRDSSNLDFAALTDHDFVNGKSLKGYPWSRLVNAAEAYNQDDIFIGIPGYEWTSNWFDHLTVLYSADPMIMYSYKDDASDHPKEIFSLLKSAGDNYLCFRPHPWNFPIRQWDWDVNLITGVEIVGFSAKYNYGIYEYYGCPNGPDLEASTPGSFVQDILAYGYRMSLLGVKDSHDGKPGKAGLTAVYADTLTRAAIFDALRKRHCYATTGARILLEFDINGNMMGEFVRLTPGQKADVTVKVAAPKTILCTEIVKNNLVVYSFLNNDTAVAFNWVDQDTIQNGYYYARVSLIDGQMAFSSPIYCKEQDRLPTPAVPGRPTPEQIIYKNEKPVFVWVLSKDPDFGDLSEYYVECEQEKTGETYLLGPTSSYFILADSNIVAGYSYRWRVITKTRDEPSVNVVSLWANFRYSLIDPFKDNSKRIYAYPNPFKEKVNCVISYNKDLKAVEVKVFDILGRIVKILYKGKNNGSTINFSWDGTDSNNRKCNSGVYFIGVFDPWGRNVGVISITRIL